MAKELTYNELLQENLELRQTIEELRKYYRKFSQIAATVYDRMKLTDEEIEAIEWCVEMMKLHATECDDELATLRNLLERTKDK